MSDSDYLAQKEVARANRAFYHAFEALDLEAMKQVWLDDDRIRCVHPGWELLIGRERVMKSWSLIFQNTAEIRVDVSDLDVHIEGDFAWVTAIENIRSDGEGENVNAQAVATHLFERREGRFQMVMHHASPVAQQGFDDFAEGYE